MLNCTIIRFETEECDLTKLIFAFLLWQYRDKNDSLTSWQFTQSL
uniref:Uncharacterized protein n=1 Tax=Romanomermis culicivorax TaxID=13658 RepID=A0A915HUI6_ROMCU